MLPEVNTGQVHNPYLERQADRMPSPTKLRQKLALKNKAIKHLPTEEHSRRSDISGTKTVKHEGNSRFANYLSSSS